MKLYKLMLMSAAAFALTACNDSDDPAPFPTYSNGDVYVICNGQMTNQIPGSITSYNIADNESTPGAFAKANGRHIGSSVESALVVYDKIYFISTNENTVEVADATTLKSEMTLKTTSMFGEKGDKPRYAAYWNGNLYITTYAGYVCTYNTLNNTPGRVYQAGSYPEGISISDGELWVANSDYGNGQNPSISHINITTGITETIKAPEIKNPYKIIASSDMVWVLDRGSYDSSWNQTGAALYSYDLRSKRWNKITDATMMSDPAGSYVVVCNAPFHTPPVTPTYALVDLVQQTVTTLPNVKVDSPAFLGIDAVNMHIYVGSYTTNPETGYANYNSDGYVNRYTSDGKYLSRFTCGVGPMDIVFTYKLNEQ